MSEKISNSLEELESAKTKFNSEIQEILKLGKENEKLATAFERLCSLVVTSNEKMHSLHEETQQSLLKILGYQYDQEVSLLEAFWKLTKK